MKALFAALDRLFFRKISAVGFGAMRAMWGGTMFVFLYLQWNDVWRYYSDQGFLPLEIEYLIQRNVLRFSILDYIHSPGAVFLVYCFFLALCLCTAIGFRTRISTVLAVLLTISFHERNYLPLAGGETVLRILGFLLMIAPNISAFSVDRLFRQWAHFKETRTLLPPPLMSIWPQQLLTWQLIVLYVTSAWDKLMGVMWWAGTATASALHHPNFVRVPMIISDVVSMFSRLFSRLTIIFEFGWLLLLIPSALVQKMGFKRGGIKRTLILSGIIFHGSIGLLMHVGSFPYAFAAAYLGLLNEDDFEALRTRFNKRFVGQRIYILYDGACWHCKRAVFTVKLLDWLQRTELVDFRAENERVKVAPDIPFEALNKSMHIRIAKTARNPILGNETLQGFDAVRRLTWHLPALWITAPFMYLPGVAPVGRKMYTRIAKARKVCEGDNCHI